jgi:hypothetical protein
MTLSNVYSMALQAYQDLIPEFKQNNEDKQRPILPALEEILAQNTSIPRDSLMLGVAMDGLPILLNLNEPAPCPIVVIGEGGSGKTNLLKNLARATDLVQDPADIQFGVVTHFPDEWQALDASPGSMGVWPANHDSAFQFIHKIVEWARQPIHGRQVMVLFLDDLAALTNTSDQVQEDLRWLLVNGAGNQVWTIASLNIVRAVRMKAWLELFNTYIFGYIQQPSMARIITAGALSDFENLTPGSEFDIKQQDNWLRFWLPALKPC